MTLQRAGFLRSVAVVLALAGASAALFWWQSADLFRPVPVGMLRTDDAAMLKHGALIYQARCASCHGVKEGQLLGTIVRVRYGEPSSLLAVSSTGCG